MKNLLIKLGLWEEAEWVTEITRAEADFFMQARQHYCEACEKWFKEARARKAHDRIVHEGVLRKNA